MTRDFKKLVILLLLPLLLLSGCKKRKPQIPSPQEQAPTIEQPPAQPPVQPPVQPPAEQPPVTTPPPVQPPPTTTKPKPKPKRRVTKKPAPEKNKNVIKEGGESSAPGQLSAGIPEGEATHQRRTTVQLREDTEKRLGSITRQLSSSELAMVQQIHAYLTQSRAADADNDTERAYNLALKAHLLADELMRQ